MGKIFLLLLPLLVYDPPGPQWPDDLQGAWELKLDWQVESGSEKGQLNNPTTYQMIVIKDQLFLYNKALSTLSATVCLAVKDRSDAEAYFFCLAKTGEKRKAIKIGGNEIVFLSHGTYKSTGFKLSKLNLEETKGLFRTVLENEALLIDNRQLRFRGKDLKKFDEDLTREQLNVMAMTENEKFKNIVWFYGNSEAEPLLRKHVEAD